MKKYIVVIWLVLSAAWIWLVWVGTWGMKKAMTTYEEGGDDWD